MRLFKKWQRTAACVLALGLVSAVVFLRPGHAQFGIPYAVTDLNTLGGIQSRAYGINNASRVVGDSTLTGGTVSPNPFAYTSGQLTNMGTFGGDSGTAYALNTLGYAAGFAATGTNDKHAFVWSDIFGKLDIGVLPGGTFASAYDINDANQVVGQSEISPLQDRGFVWEKATGMRAIISFSGAGSTAANGINNAGQIVGWSAAGGGTTHAFFLSGGTMTDLGTFGGTISIAQKINNAGVVVGHAALASSGASQPYHAFRWTAQTGLQDLGTLGGSRSIAYDINGAGTIVGTAEVTPGVFSAFVYDSQLGMRDLNSLTPASGWTLQEARGINDKGQIVGIGINPQGQTHAFLLVPQLDDIPNGEPPPCFIAPTAQPIILPQPAVFKPAQPTPTPNSPRGRR